jgi:hypothetical protein
MSVRDVPKVLIGEAGAQIFGGGDIALAEEGAFDV